MSEILEHLQNDMISLVKKISRKCDYCGKVGIEVDSSCSDCDSTYCEKCYDDHSIECVECHGQLCSYLGDCHRECDYLGRT